MAIFLAGGNGEAQVMFVVYNVNSIHKFVGYVLKERKNHGKQYQIHCNLTKVQVGYLSLRILCLFLIKGSTKDLLQV